MDPLGELGVGQPPVAHQGAQDRPVAIVDFVWIRMKIASFRPNDRISCEIEPAPPTIGETFRGIGAIMPQSMQGDGSMLIGVPKEIKDNEFRVGLTPVFGGRS